MPTGTDNAAYQECPDCQTSIHVGTGGTKNLDQHHGSSDCLKQQSKKKHHQKLTAQQCMLAAFIIPCTSTSPVSSIYATKPPTPLKPSLVWGPEPASPGMESVSIIHGTSQKISVQSASLPEIHSLPPLEQAHALTKLLPNSIPEAIEDNLIWKLGAIQPQEFAQQHCTEDRLEDWEQIDPMLNRLLGYGASEDEIVARICQGKCGVEGVVNFLTWFMENHGLETNYYKEKLECLSNAMLHLYVKLLTLL